MNKRPDSVFICIIFLLIAGQFAFGFNADEIAGKYIHETWQHERGLPFDSVSSITQTRDGFIWLALGRGVARFDGVRFTYFNHSNTPVIPNNSFKRSLEDRTGNLWLASEGGLVRYRDREFTAYTTKNGLPADIVTALFEDSAGNLWVGTDKGLARWTGERFAALNHPDIGRIYAIAEKNDGSILISASANVYLLQNGALETNPFLKMSNAYSILTDRNGRIWIGSTSGLVCLSNGETKLYTMKDGLPTDYISSLTEDGEGNLWIGTAGGVVRWNGSKFDVFNSRQGLSDEAVNQIYRARDGGLWIATNGGLDFLRPNPFAAFTKQDGLPDNHVWAVYEDRSHNIWIGTNGGGLNRIGDGRIISYRAADKMPSDKVFSIQETSDGVIIAGTDGGMAQIRDGRLTRFEPTPDSRNWVVYSFYEDRDGSLWLSTRSHGLIRLRNGQITRYNAENGFPSSRMRNAVSDGSGGIWFSTGKLNYFRDGKVRSWGAKEGVKESVYGLYSDGSRLWFGTYSGGLYLLDGEKLTSFSQAGTELSSMVFSILEDNDENLWISHEAGLQRVGKQELLDYAAGLRQSFNVMTFDRRDGLVNSEFNATGRNAGWKMADGRMIFANISGAVIFNPRDIKPNPETPPVFINEVFYDQNPVELNGAVELAPGGNNLEFRYSAPFFTAPSRIRFKYRLEGFEKEWTDAGARRTAYYTNLPPGDYRFRVIASNENGVWNENAAALEFRLQPHFYQTVWFFALIASAVGLTVLGLYKLRVHHLKRNARLLEQQVAERTKALQAEIAVREQAEESLRAARDNLENQVGRRTEELAKANSVLSEQRKFLYVTLSSIADAVVAADENGLVSFLNPVGEALTGWKMAEAAGKPLSSVLRFSANGDRTESDSSFPDILKTNALPQDRGQMQLLTRGGELVPVNLHVSQIHQEQDQAAGTVITFWDMRPQMAAEAEHRKLEEQLFRAQKMESIGTLAGGVAHDFNNLLTIILGNSDLMRMTVSADDPLARRISEINQAAHRGAEVTRQLLTFSRQQPLERRPYELTRIINDLLKLLNRIIGENIEIRVAHAPDLPPVFADSAQLGQVLMNLLVNARDAMPSGGVIQIEACRVRIDEEFCRQNNSARTGDYVRVDVSDNGTGMNEETLERIFDPFYTTKELGKGTGLGLAVVYGIIEQHSGFINVMSGVGKGTTFSIYLPVAEGETNSEAETNAGTVVRGRRETILLAEDERMLRELAQEILESNNYRVLTAADGVEAVELYRQHREEINLLLFDANMPRLDGFGAYEQISDLNNQAPILFVTGYSEDVFQQFDFLNTPNRAVLLKPYEPDVLLNKIRELIDAGQICSGSFERESAELKFS